MIFNFSLCSLSLPPPPFLMISPHKQFTKNCPLHLPSHFFLTTGPTLRLNTTIARDYQQIIALANYSRLFPDLVPTTSNKESVSEEKLVTLQEWRWVYAIFRSRNWKTPKGPKINTVLELFNYGQEVFFPFVFFSFVICSVHILLRRSLFHVNFFF